MNLTNEQIQEITKLKILELCDDANFIMQEIQGNNLFNIDSRKAALEIETAFLKLKVSLLSDCK